MANLYGATRLKRDYQWVTVVMDYTLATKLIDNLHPNQRNRKKSKIEQYCADMLAGRWRPMPHQCVGVDVEGFTMNGQNTLFAWLKAYSSDPTVEVEMTICYGVPSESMVATDTGVARSVNDAAKVQGVNFSNKSYASVARRMKTAMNRRDRAMTIQETLAFVSDYEEGLNFCFEAMAQNLKGVTQAAVKAVVGRAFYTRDKARLKQFGQELISGLCDNAKTDAAVITLRNWLWAVFEGGSAVVRRKPGGVYAYTEFALDAYLKRQRITRLEPAAVELFPLPGKTPKEEVCEAS